MRWPEGWLYRLDDPADPWIARDKAEHAALAAGGAIGACWIGLAPVAAAIAVAGYVGIAVELVELVRWRRWRRAGYPAPWPWLCDRVSLKDLAWDGAGALVGALWAAWAL